MAALERRLVTSAVAVPVGVVLAGHRGEHGHCFRSASGGLAEGPLWRAK